MRNKLLAIALLSAGFLAAQYVPPGGGGGGSLPTGSGNCVVASPANGSSATVACRALVGVDIPKLLELGAAGDAAGTVGLHIMGKGAFDVDGVGTKSQLWLDSDDESSYHLVFRNRGADPSRFAGMQVYNNGLFELDVYGAASGIIYRPSTDQWEFYGTAAVSATSLVTNALTVATLPASPVAGQRAFVTDSNAVSFTAGIGAVVAAGGSTKVPVVYDGTNWRIG